MGAYDLFECPVCGQASYATKGGMVRKHFAPGTYRAEDRAHCPGSGKAPAKVVER